VSAAAVVAELRARGSEANRAGMARYGIAVESACGVPVRELRLIARRLGRSHQLAADLWASGLHEARILASIVDVPGEVTEAQMEAWAAAFDSWDLCDQCCANLFRRTPFAIDAARRWAGREETFVKRAGFALMAQLGGHGKKTPDDVIASFLALIEREADDERNFVKKAVNWALREIGKRDSRWRAEAMAVAERLIASDARAARWVGADAARELRGRPADRPPRYPTSPPHPPAGVDR
jgi:3-methyladenine DNA glycosylase AlkD